MANLILIAQNTSLYTLSATGSDASYPLTNLQDYVEATQWKSSVLTDLQWLKIDFGSAVAIDSVVIGNHNMATIISAGGHTLYLDYSDDDANWYNATGWTHPSADPNPLYATFASLTHRYWRLSFERGGTFPTYPAIGNFYLGKKFDAGAPYNFPYKAGAKRFATSEGVALNGLIRTSQMYAGGRKIWKIKFASGNSLGATARANWITFFDLIQGRFRPFYLVDIDGTTVVYCHADFDEDPMDAIRANLNEIPDIIFKAAMTV